MGTIWSALIGQHTRVYLIESTDMVEAARRIHGTFPVATAAMGRSLTAASLMGKMLKGEREKLTFQVRGSRLIRSIVAVAWPSGDVKVTLSDPKVDLEDRADGKLNVGGAIGSEGELIIIRDFGLKEPYIGRSPLVSGEIAEDLAQYYLHSEQQPSIVSLGVHVNPDHSVSAAGGLIAQPMPTIDDEELSRLEATLGKMPAISGVMMTPGTPEERLEALFPGLEVKVTGTYPVELICDCSKSKLEKALISIGRKDLEEILREDGQATLTCHFCNQSYVFDGQDLQALLDSLDEK